MDIMSEVTICDKLILIERIYEEYLHQAKSDYRKDVLKMVDKISNSMKTIEVNHEVIKLSLDLNLLSGEETFNFYESFYATLSKFSIITICLHNEVICQLLASTCLFLNQKIPSKGINQKLVCIVLTFC